MNSRVFFLAAFALVSASVSGQYYQGPQIPSFCGDTASAPSSAKYDWNYSEHFTKLTRVGNIFMPSFGSGSTMGDSMTQPYWADSSLSSGNPWGSLGWDEMWYMPAEADGSARGALYRLYSSTYQDHMDSETSTEGSMYGYGNEGEVAFPFTSAPEGTSPVTRYYSGVFDHRTERPGLSLSSTNGNGTTVSYGEEFRWNNTTSGRPNLYAYPRYGTRYTLGTSSGRCTALTYGYVNQLDNNRVKVQFNREWGNAIGRIIYDADGSTSTTNDRRQLVDDINIGALVQSVLWVEGPSTATQYLLNPTEAGGWDNDNPSNAFRWAGSPILSIVPTGTFNPGSPATISLKTRLKPLNYYHNVYTDTANSRDTTQQQPIMWRGVFERETILGYQYKTGTAGYLNNVIKVGFKANVDADVPDDSTDPLQDTDPYDRDIYDGTNLMTSYFIRLHNFGTNGSATVPPTDAVSKLRLMAYRMNTGAETSLATSTITGSDANGDFTGEYTINTSSYPKTAIIAYTDGGGFALGFASQPAAIGDSSVAYKIFLTGKASPTHNDDYAGQNIAVLPYRFRDLRSATDHHDTFLIMGTLAEVKTTLQRIHCKENNGTCT